MSGAVEGLADHARHFVEAMWSPDCDCFPAGTGDDGETRSLFKLHAGDQDGVVGQRIARAGQALCDQRERLVTGEALAHHP